jgi:murein DD-endopeptidase MepM/ murein hydrolase activator NlpD
MNRVIYNRVIKDDDCNNWYYYFKGGFHERCYGGWISNSGSSSTPTTDPNKPKRGNPVKNPKIAPSIREDGTKNIQGGRYGLTRSDGTVLHKGLDIYAPIGSDLYNIRGGKVVDRTPASQIAAPGTYGAGDFGNTIEIETTLSNGDIIRIKYSHLNTIKAAYGSTIKEGTIIGTSGKTGNAMADKIIPHVHISVRKKVNGVWEYQNPEKYIRQKFNADGSVKK